MWYVCLLDVIGLSKHGAMFVWLKKVSMQQMQWKTICYDENSTKQIFTSSMHSSSTDIWIFLSFCL